MLKNGTLSNINTQTDSLYPAVAKGQSKQFAFLIFFFVNPTYPLSLWEY